VTGGPEGNDKVLLRWSFRETYQATVSRRTLAAMLPPEVDPDDDAAGGMTDLGSGQPGKNEGDDAGLVGRRPCESPSSPAAASVVVEDEAGQQWYIGSHVGDHDARHALLGYLLTEADIPSEEAWALAGTARVSRGWFRYVRPDDDGMVPCEPDADGAEAITVMVDPLVPCGGAS
jgi:hypothetical protein